METQSTSTKSGKSLSGASEDVEPKNVSLPACQTSSAVWPGVNSIELPQEEKKLINIVNIRDHGEPR